MATSQSRPRRSTTCRLWLVAVEVVVEQPRPAAAQADNLVAAVGGGVHERLDAGVEAGDVAASGEHADPGHADASHRGVVPGGRAALPGPEFVAGERPRPESIASAAPGRRISSAGGPRAGAGPSR